MPETMMEGRCLTDRFWILETIGAGGVTEISLAHDRELGERVAVRLLAESMSAHWEVLRDACRDGRQLAHPHIARVFDFHRDDDAVFVSREYVEGVDVGVLTANSTEERLADFASVAAALESAHDLGIIHGDLKASKILRDARGNIRLTDFRYSAALRTVTFATPAGDHLSPQVRAGEIPVAADDIYSLGHLLAWTLDSASTPTELRELIEGMSAEQRSARPSDLREIRQALVASSRVGAVVPDATLSTAPLARPAAAVALLSDEPLRPKQPADSSRNLHYAIAAGVLAVAAGTVFFVLPRWVESLRAPRASIDAAEPGDEAGPPLAVVTPTASKESAESLLAQLPPMRERLEASAVDRWGTQEYVAARELERRGDAAFIQGDYGAAREHYNQALTDYESLLERLNVVLAESLENGSAALEENDQPRALESFGLALAIDPGHAAATEGMRRAENLPALLAHMSAGERFERDDVLDAAQREYAQAVDIDPQFAPARVALERVDTALAGEAYAANLSLALSSMASGRLGTARKHFEEARALRPESPEVADGLRQLQQLESSRVIAKQRELAETAEQGEKWSEAAAHYQTIIDTQSHLQFAEEGLRRNRELARITKRMAELLEDPTQLFQPQALAEADELMAIGKVAAEQSPKLAEQLGNLQIAVQLASTPIPVVFESDSLTEVVIRGVGTLGGFARRDVSLKPGRYVVVGRRDGYRDTRTEISVLPGRKQPVVEVRCTEKI